MLSTVGSPGKLARNPSSVTVVVFQSWAERGTATTSATTISGIKRMASPVSTASGRYDIASVYDGPPAEHGEQHEKPHDVRERDVPAVLEPERHGFRLGVAVRERDAGRGAEPDH